MTISYTSIIVITLLSLLVLSLMIRANGHLDGLEKRRFYIICLMIAVAACSEWLAVLFDGAPMWTRNLHLMAKCLDYSTTPVCCLPFIQQMSENKRLIKVTKVIIAANILFQIASVFTGWTFYVDEQNIHCHGPLYICYVIICAVAILFVILSFLEYGQHYENKNRLPLFSILVLLIISIAFQEGFGGEVRTDYLGMAIATIMLYIHYIEFKQISLDRDIVQKEALLTTDSLTGALSRFAYMQVLSDYTDDKPVPDWLIAFEADLNGLKGVNDSLGHSEGDKLLRGAGQVLKDVVADKGRVFRTGGDEFVIILDAGLMSAEEADRLIRERAKAWKGLEGCELSFSIGHAAAEEFPSYNLLQLVHEADQRMYEDKAEYYSQPGHERRKAFMPVDKSEDNI